jgi:hypothetical protein
VHVSICGYGGVGRHPASCTGAGFARRCLSRKAGRRLGQSAPCRTLQSKSSAMNILTANLLDQAEWFATT